MGSPPPTMRIEGPPPHRAIYHFQRTGEPSGRFGRRWEAAGGALVVLGLGRGGRWWLGMVRLPDGRTLEARCESMREAASWAIGEWDGRLRRPSDRLI